MRFPSLGEQLADGDEAGVDSWYIVDTLEFSCDFLTIHRDGGELEGPGAKSMYGSVLSGRDDPRNLKWGVVVESVNLVDEVTRCTSVDEVLCSCPGTVRNPVWF